MNKWIHEWKNEPIQFFHLVPIGVTLRQKGVDGGQMKNWQLKIWRRGNFFFPFVWMRSYKLLWKEEQRQTEQSMQTHPAQVLPMLPQSRDLFASHNYYVLELALGAQSFPLLIFPLLTPAISFWQSSPFILFSLQVWLLAVPAEGKVFYKTLISFSLIPFF